MECTTHITTDGSTHMAISGDVTIYQAAEFQRCLVEAIRAGTVLDIDLSQVTAMDTAGFQLLVLAKRESTRLGRVLRIVTHSPAVREVIEFFDMVAFFGDPLVIPADETA